MAISDKLTYLNQTKQNIKTAINNHGGTLTDQSTFRSYPTEINSVCTDLERYKTLFPTEIVEGESISITNGQALPYKNYVIKGKSIQDGTPSPSNPSEIHSVADDVNLFDKTKVTSGWLNQSGQIESSSNYVVSDFIEVKEGEKYYIPNRGTTRTKYYKSDKTVYSNIWDVSDVAQVINIPSEVKYIRFSILINGTNAIDINTFKLQKGTVATPYSPYNQGTVTIKQRGTTESDDYIIQTEPLRSLPNGVRDSLEDDGIHRRVGRIVLDGSETWYRWGANLFYITKISKTKTSLSNYYVFKENSTSATSLNNGEYMIHDSLNNYVVVFKNTEVSDSINSFKTWLSTHNTEVLYELAEEVIEPLTQNQATTMLDIIKTGSYEGTTNIYTDEDVKPTIGVGYYKKG